MELVIFCLTYITSLAVIVCQELLGKIKGKSTLDVSFLYKIFQEIEGQALRQKSLIPNEAANKKVQLLLRFVIYLHSLSFKNQFTEGEKDSESMELQNELHDLSSQQLRAIQSDYDVNNKRASSDESGIGNA